MDHTSDYEDGPHYELLGKLTGYRLLAIGMVAAFAIYELILLVYGYSTLPTLLELVIGVLIGVLMYLLGTYQHAAPPVMPKFFHTDYTPQASPYLRTLTLFFSAFVFTLYAMGLPMIVGLLGAWIIYFAGWLSGGSDILLIVIFFVVAFFCLWVGITLHAVLSKIPTIRDTSIRLYNFGGSPFLSLTLAATIKSLRTTATDRTMPGLEPYHLITDVLGGATGAALAIYWIAHRLIGLWLDNLTPSNPESPV